MGAGPKVLLISTYELGRQPFGLASPAAWLAEAGAEVACLDLSVQRLDERSVEAADVIALYLPMHTATRIATPLLPRLKRMNPTAHVCAYGIYAPANADYLHSLGVDTILGGEFEAELAAIASGRAADGRANGASAPAGIAKQRFRAPDRSGLPALKHYAYLKMPDDSRRTVGYTEASRGCKHLCRHCPIVPVYDGAFRIVQRDVVLADIRHQAAAGAEHISFGDPDFFNGPGHSLKIVEAMHAEFPDLTYDVVIKIEHLLRHADLLPRLRDTNCLFVTSAVESFEDAVLEALAKRHTRADVAEAVSLCRAAGLQLSPTFVAFTPWTTLPSYGLFLQELARLGFVDSISPIQYGIRLLVPASSRLLELEDIAALVQPFDAESLSHPWSHSDPGVDAFHADVLALVAASEKAGTWRRDVFDSVWRLLHGYMGVPAPPPPEPPVTESASVSMSEPWYCCAEPGPVQLAGHS
jgi:radical SAM superfamily enzyme YgiQ (UPF0313 family)